MANIKSSKKRARQEQKRRKVNVKRKSDLKTAVKKVQVAVEQKDPKMVEFLREAESKLSRSKGKAGLHKNTVRRKVSRLAKKVAEASK